MSIDSNFVTKEFKRYIWPLCKIHGFSKINGRTMWRFREGAIDVINLQGDRWNGLEGQPHGFFINLGVYLTGIERSWTRQERGTLVPTESQCDLRGRLKRPVSDWQNGSDWTIDRDGNNVEEVMKSLQVAFEETGFSWFRRFWEPTETLRYMMETEGENEHGLGRLGSPHRNMHTGLYALSLGRFDLAGQYLAEYEAFCKAEPDRMQGELYGLVTEGLTRARAAKNASV